MQKRDNKKPSNKKYDKNQSARDSFRNKDEAPRERRKKFEEEEVEDNYQLEGRNSVLEAINSGKTIDKILLKKGEVDGTLKVIKAKALDRGIIVQETSKQNLDDMAKTHNHQGVIAICPAHEYAEVEDILALAKERGEDPFIIILDGITDTYNLGAIIRSADAVGAHGVIIPKRRSAGLTAVVSKTSAGALEYVKVAKVTNIGREIEKLKKEGIWVMGTTMDGQLMYNANLTGPIALVIGSEGDGIGNLVSQKCDHNVSIPMYGKIQSLNASVASGVLMYEVVRQRRLKLM